MVGEPTTGGRERTRVAGGGASERSRETLELGFVGDVMLGRNVDDRQRRRPAAAVWGSTRDRLAALDGLFVNLECCLSTRGDRWTETYRPFHFRADPGWAVPALRDVGVTWANLANNHVLDFGEAALDDTFRALDDAEIPYGGAGRTDREAWRPTRVRVGGLDVALVAFTDNTPEYVAGAAAPGTAHVEIDPTDDDCLDRVGAALSAGRASGPDLLVASLHWGPNMREFPPQRFRAFARWLVDGGADVVYGHSAHVFQGVEVYDGSLVCYDAGDFVDDYAVDDVLRNDRGFLFEVRVTAGGVVDSLRLRPTEIRDCAVEFVPAGAVDWWHDRMRARSAPFGTDFETAGADLLVRVADAA